MNTKKLSGFVTQNAIYIVLILLIAGIALKDPRFLDIGILRDILLQNSTRAIIALGAAFILITGGTDLSSGRVVGLSAVLSASMLQISDYPRRFFPDMPELWVGLPILFGILAGLIVGLINGWVVAKLNVPPFIATLGRLAAGLYQYRLRFFRTERALFHPLYCADRRRGRGDRLDYLQ
jgi:methyl-galactoside transport system permease protein